MVQFSKKQRREKMTGVITAIGINLISNTIYDIVKYMRGKFCNEKSSRKKDLKEAIIKQILTTASEDIKPYLESSTFAEYFNSTQFVDAINAYIEQKIICDFTNEGIAIKKKSKKALSIDQKELIDYIASGIYSLYSKNEVVIEYNLSDIKKAVLFILCITEKYVASTLPSDQTALLYFSNSRLDYYYENISTMLSSLKEVFSKTREIDITERVREFEETKEKYYRILKDKNSDAHIYLLDRFPFDKFYVPPILQRCSTVFTEDSTREFPRIGYAEWKDIFDTNHIVYLIGGAGYGKSLFTKKIINSYTDLNIYHPEEYLVIYGELKEFYPNGSDSYISVPEFLKKSIRSSTMMDVSTEFIQYYLNAGRCIILLDALDEVEKNKRNTLHETVVAFFKNENPNNKICITSRDRGFIPERDIEVFMICPLNKRQIEQYVDKIIALRKFEKTDKAPFMRQSQILAQKGFLNSFLVLSLLINIYKAELELPENKLELYQKCFDYIARKREKEKTINNFNWDSISPILKENTFIELSQMGVPNNSNIDKNDIKNRLLTVYKTKYSCEAETENAIEEFLKFCTDRTELFVPTSEDKYRFFHRSFFEYFYSLYIYTRFNDSAEIIRQLKKFDVDSEVFELTVATLKKNNEIKYQELISTLIYESKNEFAKIDSDFQSFNILILSMQVVDDAVFKNKLLNIILDNKAIIFKNKEKIHNLRLIPDYFQNDSELSKKLFEAYNDECLMLVLSNYDKVCDSIDEFEKDFNDDLFDETNKGYFKFKFNMRRKIFSGFFDDYHLFLINIILLINNCQETLLSVSDERMLTLYKKFSPRNYRKRTEKTRANIQRFTTFSQKKQAAIIMSIQFKDY